MVFLGHNAIVMHETGKTADANPFTPDYKSLQGVNFVNETLLNEDQHTIRACILVFKNALYVPSMQHNLVPLFVIREAEIKVSDARQIHVDYPSVNDHAKWIPDQQLRIPLHLHKISSYFLASTPSDNQLKECSIHEMGH
eukprot:11745672-Ditylum_brightwellii.AAC.1